MNLLKSIVKRFTDKNYRFQAVVGEITPVFSDRFGTSNKKRIVLERDDERVPFVELETQNGEPVEFHKGFEYFGKDDLNHKGDLDFEVNGMRADMVYSLERTGYLENSDSLYRVILVTDKYVYSKSLGSGGIILHSHSEIERFENMNAMTIERKSLGAL